MQLLIYWFDEELLIFFFEIGLLILVILFYFIEMLYSVIMIEYSSFMGILILLFDF